MITYIEDSELEYGAAQFPSAAPFDPFLLDSGRAIPQRGLILPILSCPELISFLDF